ncbi:hypothetical protein TNCV_966251 [Trichonephila clavipes]|nr:hypothetical protein TNCV_966251 [Trichonephila clavipes]
MDHQHLFRLRCVTTSMLYILGGGLDAKDTCCFASTIPGPQFLAFLLLGIPEIACVWDAGGYSGESLNECVRQFFVHRIRLCYDIRGRNFKLFL